MFNFIFERRDRISKRKGNFLENIFPKLHIIAVSREEGDKAMLHQKKH